MHNAVNQHVFNDFFWVYFFPKKGKLSIMGQKSGQNSLKQHVIS